MVTMERAVADLTATVAALEAEINHMMQTVRDRQAVLERKRITLDELRMINESSVIPSATNDRTPVRRRQLSKGNRELVLDVVRGANGPIKDAEILDRLYRIGWTSTADKPLNIVRSYLSRLATDKLIRRTDPMVWEAVRSDTEAPTELSVGASVPDLTRQEGGEASDAAPNSVRDDDSFWQAKHRVLDNGAPVVG